MNVDTFGFTEIMEFTAKKLFLEKKNIYVQFYVITPNKELVKTEVFILDKREIDFKYPKEQLKIHTSYVDRLDKKDTSFYLVNTTEKEFLKDIGFRNAYNHIVMKNVFPNQIMQTFYYTDYRTVTPKEFEYQLKKDEPKHKQLTMFE